jgi:hypothetical protein
MLCLTETKIANLALPDQRRAINHYFDLSILSNIFDWRNRKVIFQGTVVCIYFRAPERMNIEII